MGNGTLRTDFDTGLLCTYLYIVVVICVLLHSILHKCGEKSVQRRGMAREFTPSLKKRTSFTGKRLSLSGIRKIKRFYLTLMKSLGFSGTPHCTGTPFRGHASCHHWRNIHGITRWRSPCSPRRASSIPSPRRNDRLRRKMNGSPWKKMRPPFIVASTIATIFPVLLR